MADNGHEGLVVLDRNDVTRLLPMRECVDVMAAALATVARGNAILPLRPMIRLPDSPNIFALMPAYLGEPKSTAGRRTLAMPGPLADVLAAHAAALGLTAADPEALLFPAPDGGLLRYSNWLRRSWWLAMVAAGLGTLERNDTGRWHYDGPGFHDLRRTSATALVVDGVDVKTAQYRLGHSSPVLTLSLYAQAVTAAERDAADRIGVRLMSPPQIGPRDGRAMEREHDDTDQRRQHA